ncbi:MAG: hypothetical protein M5U28_29240 [Sandaracinaceae bacterium]|nr:hypothetical protein [Sandaracinaceae bacterium]
MAHDLRNPLGAMKMGLSLIQCREADASGRRALSLLDRQVDRMSRMVGDLLDATRIEAGRLSLREEELDLRERAREAIELHAPSFRGTASSSTSPRARSWSAAIRVASIRSSTTSSPTP